MLYILIENKQLVKMGVVLVKPNIQTCLLTFLSEKKTTTTTTPPPTNTKINLVKYVLAKGLPYNH